MIVFEPKRINQWQLSRFVPSGIIYGRMGRTMRNYGLRIISSPENKHSLLRRGRKSLPDLHITDDEHVDLREDLCHECRRITRESGYEINDNDYWRACPLSHTVDDLWHLSSRAVTAKLKQVASQNKQGLTQPPGPIAISCMHVKSSYRNTS